WQLIKMHPQIAVNILKPIKNFDEVANWIKYHHERMDGNGYNGLKGEDIPLASRIIALADTYSAITMTRPYRPTLNYEDALSELRLVTGSQLDPFLVEIFCSIPRNKVLSCMEDVEEKMSRAKIEKIKSAEKDI
ncbi:MAG: HD domain-containing protein, partial [Lachnospiraceae bacterium]|nr:HD domain-containing protein [Lachnospiraceae bacterium]